MKKILFVFLSSFAFLFLLSGQAQAKECAPAQCNNNSNCDNNAWQGAYSSYAACYAAYGGSGATCGSTTINHADVANSLVPCGQYPDCRCELTDIFVMGKRIFDFIVWTIATPLAGLLIVFGGVLMIISGGPGGKNPITGIASPNLYNTAKNMIWWAIISILLIFGSWLIVDIVLRIIGYTGTWSSIF